MGLSNAERQKRHRDKARDVKIEDGTYNPRGWAGAARKQPYNVKGGRARYLPFLSMDGEGGGIDASYRQDYSILTCGDRELHTGQRLTTLECLETLRSIFLCCFCHDYVQHPVNLCGVAEYGIRGRVTLDILLVGLRGILPS